MGQKLFDSPLDVARALRDLGVDIDTDSFSGVFMGRNLRVSASMSVDVGSEDFDRWANSEEYSITVTKRDLGRKLSRLRKLLQ